jgi:hypothetical protein
LEKEHVRRGGLSTRLDSGVGQYQAAAKKKVKYHDDFYMKPHPRQKSGHALACARVFPPMPLHHVIYHT